MSSQSREFTIHDNSVNNHFRVTEWVILTPVFTPSVVLELQMQFMHSFQCYSSKMCAIYFKLTLHYVIPRIKEGLNNH